MRDGYGSMVKIANFCNIEAFMDSDFVGEPSIVIFYLSDDVKGTIDISSGTIEGEFSKYVRLVIVDWLNNKAQLLEMWNTKRLKMLPEWE